MNARKKILFPLNKCYALSPLRFQGEDHFLVGAEKQDASYLVCKDGTPVGPVFDAPGGVMTMEPLPNRDAAFLCTREFYSPNDGKKARIEYVRAENGKWKVSTLADIPNVHRFGILCRAGIQYLIVCTIKNDYEGRDDWRQPGSVYAAVLPQELECFDSEHQLRLYPIATGLWKNHGFSKYTEDGTQTALVGAESGLYQFIPPAGAGDAWTVKQLLDIPCSDAVIADFDGDGQPEIGCITPFHGDDLQIYKNGEKIWQMPYPMEMLHATYLGSRSGKPVWFVGCRKGVRQTLALYYRDGRYCTDILDTEAGAANALQLDENTLVCTNHTTGEVVMYTLED